MPSPFTPRERVGEGFLASLRIFYFRSEIQRGNANAK
jgi:hypothetical protein